MHSRFEEKMQADRLALEQFFAALLQNPQEPQQRLFEAMRYSLLAGGKRIRPILTLEFCRISGGETEKAVPFAAAVEMVHTYSLIHDDLPCMDNDDYRRGRLTNHKVYGEATAVLAGDALLTEAFQMLSLAELPPERIVAAGRTLSACAGACGMVGGQVLDMDAETRPCTKEEILAIQSRKTGCLIRAACQLGVHAAGGSGEQLHAAGAFADSLGLAFQIRDDILDVTGSQEALGKAVHVDEHKNTFVKLYGLARCEQLVQEETERAVSALSAFSETEFLRTLAERLCTRNH